MKAKVTKRFRDIETKKVYGVDRVYEGSEKRVKELADKGFVKIAKQKNAAVNVLEGSVDEVKKATEGSSSERYKTLIKEEKAGKNRKSVIDHFTQMVEQAETKKEGE